MRKPIKRRVSNEALDRMLHDSYTNAATAYGVLDEDRIQRGLSEITARAAAIKAEEPGSPPDCCPAPSRPARKRSSSLPMRPERDPRLHRSGRQILLRVTLGLPPPALLALLGFVSPRTLIALTIALGLGFTVAIIPVLRTICLSLRDNRPDRLEQHILRHARNDSRPGAPPATRAARDEPPGIGGTPTLF